MDFIGKGVLVHCKVKYQGEERASSRLTTLRTFRRTASATWDSNPGSLGA